MSDFPVQTCRDCGIEKPLTPEFWHKDSKRECGLRTACKVCVNEHEHIETELGQKQTLTRIENMGLELLDKLCEQPVTPGKRMPHIAEMFQVITNVFGGVEGFGRQVGATYFAAKPGSQTRQRILESGIRLGVKVSEMGFADHDFKNVSTKDVERILRERLREEAEAALPRILEMQKPDDVGLSGPLADAS